MKYVSDAGKKKLEFFGFELHTFMHAQRLESGKQFKVDALCVSELQMMYTVYVNAIAVVIHRDY